MNKMLRKGQIQRYQLNLLSTLPIEIISNRRQKNEFLSLSKPIVKELLVKLRDMRDDNEDKNYLMISYHGKFIHTCAGGITLR